MTSLNSRAVFWAQKAFPSILCSATLCKYREKKSRADKGLLCSFVCVCESERGNRAAADKGLLSPAPPCLLAVPGSGPQPEGVQGEQGQLGGPCCLQRPPGQMQRHSLVLPHEFH